MRTAELGHSGRAAGRCALLRGRLRRLGARRFAALDVGEAALERLHQVDGRRLGQGLGARDRLAGKLRLEQPLEITPVLARKLLRVEATSEALDHLAVE